MIFLFWLYGFYIDASPQIPAGDAPVGFPTAGDLLHLRGLEDFAFIVELLDRHLHSEISGRQHVRPLQREHQKHLRRPNANTFHLCQVLDDRFVRLLVQLAEVELAARRPLCHIAQIRRFLFGQTNRPHLLVCELEDSRGRQRVAGQSGKAVEDRGRRLPIQLLVKDRLGQAVKFRRGLPYGIGPLS